MSLPSDEDLKGVAGGQYVHNKHIVLIADADHKYNSVATIQDQYKYSNPYIDAGFYFLYSLTNPTNQPPIPDT